METFYAADGSVESVQPIWNEEPEERHDYSHDRVQLQLQQMALGISGATAEDVKEMEILKKMGETMTLDDISAHLVEEAGKVFALLRENQDQEVEMKRKIGTFCSMGMRVTAEKRKRSMEASMEEKKRAGQRPGGPLHQPTEPSENVYNTETGREGLGAVRKWKWPKAGEVTGETDPQEMEERLKEMDKD